MSSSAGVSPAGRSVRGWPTALPLLALTIAVAAGAWAGIELTRGEGRIASLWPPNGLVVAVLLLTPAVTWPAWLLAALAGNLLASTVAGDPLPTALLLAACNLVEMAAVPAALRRVLGASPPDLTRPRDLLWFGAICATGATGSALLADLALHVAVGSPPGSVVPVWLPADLLGLLVVTPLCLGFHQATRREAGAQPRAAESLVVMLVVLGTSTATFAQSAYPFLFLIIPAILLAVWRLGMIGAVSGVALASLVGIVFTVVLEAGPLTLVPGSGMVGRVQVLQVFLGVTSTLALWVAAQRAERNRLIRNLLLQEADLREREERFRLIAEHAGEVLFRVGRDGRLTYVSPAAERIHGVEPAALLGSSPLDQVLPEDRERLAGPMAELLAGRQDQYRAELRISRPDGTVLWIESIGRLVRLANGTPDGYVAISSDISARHAAEEHQALLVREVDHRAKNALAVALSFVRLAPRDDAAEFAKSVEGRIAAMARAHSILARERWDGADLREILEGELTAYMEQVVLEGPSVRVSTDSTQPIAMLAHELATNAAKYGAVSVPDGRLHVGWDLSRPDGGLRLRWRESGGPRLFSPPARSGFGSRLLATLAERQLGGGVALDWRAEGLSATLEVPARHVAPGTRSPGDRRHSARGRSRHGTERSSAPPKGTRPRVLIVEDETLLAMEVEAALRTLGCDVVGPARTLPEAIRLAATEPYLSAAILDVNLGDGDMVYPVADLLAKRNVPIVFATGYDSAMLPEEAKRSAVAVLRKPYPQEALASALSAALAG